jgi:hypothetical protein
MTNEYSKASGPRFAEVKAILDFLVRDRTENLTFIHGDRFGWASIEDLREAIARPRGSTTGYPLIQSEMVGNGQAEETNLIRVLRGTLPGIYQMPFGGDIDGDFATEDQIAIIAKWINDGMPS